MLGLSRIVGDASSSPSWEEAGEEPRELAVLEDKRDAAMARRMACEGRRVGS